MDDLVEMIEGALRAQGRSARHVSLQATGSEDFIRGLRRGHIRSVTKFRALCEELNLEFYVGPKRELGAVDERRLEDAIQTSDQLLAEGEFAVGTADRAALIAAVYAIIGEERSPATPARLRRVVAALAGRQGVERSP